MHIKVLHVTKVGPMCTQESSQLNILGQRLTHRFVTISAGSVSGRVIQQYHGPGISVNTCFLTIPISIGSSQSTYTYIQHQGATTALDGIIYQKEQSLDKEQQLRKRISDMIYPFPTKPWCFGSIDRSPLRVLSCGLRRELLPNCA